MSREEDWPRFGKFVAARRAELDLTQEEAVARSHGGISVATWRKVEHATDPPYRQGQLVALCRGLDWSPLSIDAILAGGDPVLASEEPFDALAAVRQIQQQLDLVVAHLSGAADRGKR